MLNNEILRAVRTERQTSDCDEKCRITFSFQWMFYVHTGLNSTGEAVRCFC